MYVTGYVSVMYVNGILVKCLLGKIYYYSIAVRDFLLIIIDHWHFVAKFPCSWNSDWSWFLLCNNELDMYSTIIWDKHDWIVGHDLVWHVLHILSYYWNYICWQFQLHNFLGFLNWMNWWTSYLAIFIIFLVFWTFNLSPVKIGLTNSDVVISRCNR